MQGVTQEKLLLVYDPSLVRVCGGVAATLLYNWFEEHLFKATAGAPVTVPSFQWLYEALGMRQRHFCKTLKTIAAVHYSSKSFQLARIGGLEFIHRESRLEVFYALEITFPSKACIIHRNHSAITQAFHPGDKRASLPILPMAVSAKSRAKQNKMAFFTAIVRSER